jgi:hypothetical protein
MVCLLHQPSGSGFHTVHSLEFHLELPSLVRVLPQPPPTITTTTTYYYYYYYYYNFALIKRGRAENMTG